MFNNLLGNENIKELLTNAVKNNKTSHSYMFVGTEGIGKKMIASEKKQTHTTDMGCGSLVINLNMSVSNFIY